MAPRWPRDGPPGLPGPPHKVGLGTHLDSKATSFSVTPGVTVELFRDTRCHSFLCFEFLVFYSVFAWKFVILVLPRCPPGAPGYPQGVVFGAQCDFKATNFSVTPGVTVELFRDTRCHSFSSSDFVVFDSIFDGQFVILVFPG